MSIRETHGSVTNVLPPAVRTAPAPIKSVESVMRNKSFYLITIILAAAATLNDFRVKVTPRVVMAGSAVRVTCSVPRHPDNRKVRWGFTEWTASERQLDGESSRITWELLLEHVPCEPGEAFCEVTRAGGGSARVVQGVTIAGCN